MPETAYARIRAATVLDAADLAAAQLQGWREAHGDVIPEQVYREREVTGPRWWQEALADPQGPTTWLAQREGDVVGLARAVAPGAGHVRALELQVLCVLAAEQGRRTGTHLLQMAVGDAPCAVWVADGDDRTQEFYRAHGFEADGARRTAADRGDLAEVRMVR